MPTTAQRAEGAIVDYLQRRRPGELQLVWRQRKPDTHWGMQLTAWRDRASRIIGHFNSLDAAGPQINRRQTGVRNALRYFHDRMLGEFEQYMIDKAEGTTSTIVANAEQG